MCEMVDRSIGMQKNRPQVKKTILRGKTCPTHDLRPSSGHGSPECPEPLHSRVADLTEAGAPRYFVHGTRSVAPKRRSPAGGL
eukprot:2381724-Pyramimonas_sp.AAC.1